MAVLFLTRARPRPAPNPIPRVGATLCESLDKNAATGVATPDMSFVHADGRGDRIRKNSLQQFIETVVAFDFKEFGDFALRRASSIFSFSLPAPWGFGGGARGGGLNGL